MTMADDGAVPEADRGDDQSVEAAQGPAGSQTRDADLARRERRDRGRSAA
jgi:hypothetical protein